MKKIIQKIFSVRNSIDCRHKVITILGIKIKVKKEMPIKNLYVGCGEDFLCGYVGCDIRKTKTTRIICKAWEISKKVSKLENIYSRHMCEHLTFQEFQYTLEDWIKALAPMGKIHIIVPNIDYHIEQFQRAKFNLESLNESRSDLSWSLAGFYGWQREDYISSENKNKYWDVHKSCYNVQLMKLYLERAGFIHINCEIIDNVHLSVTARKPLEHDFSLNSGERQSATNLSQIRQDHINRYNLVCDIVNDYFGVNNQTKGLDCFCGNGYGTYLIANTINTNLDAVDGSLEAVDCAKQYYSKPNIKYMHCLFPFDLNEKKYDFVVSLESIEHVKNDILFLKTLHLSLKENGILVISTPNQEKQDLSINPNHFHYRHYFNDAFIELTKSIGFEFIDLYGQDVYLLDDEGRCCGLLDACEMNIKKNYNGQFSIFVFKKI